MLPITRSTYGDCHGLRGAAAHEDVGAVAGRDGAVDLAGDRLVVIDLGRSG